MNEMIFWIMCVAASILAIMTNISIINLSVNIKRMAEDIYQISRDLNDIKYFESSIASAMYDSGSRSQAEILDDVAHNLWEMERTR